MLLIEFLLVWFGVFIGLTSGLFLGGISFGWYGVVRSRI